MKQEPRFGERLRAAVAAFRNPNPPCRHNNADHWCVECSRDKWADVAVSLKLKLQEARRV